MCAPSSQFSPFPLKGTDGPGGEHHVKTDSQALVRGCGTGHRRIRGDVGGNSGSGSRDGSLDWLECEQRILQCSQFAPVTTPVFLISFDVRANDSMTRFTSGFAFAASYRFIWVAAAEQLGEG